MIQRRILGLVFSKDRALQLEACLDSCALHATEAAAVRMVVVYGASSARFLGQYEALARWHSGTARFVPDRQFRSRVLEVLRSSAARGPDAQGSGIIGRLWQKARLRTPPPGMPAECVLFLVDDTLFVGPFDLAAAQSALHANPDALGFSLRLGRNTIRSYVHDRRQELPRFQEAGEGILKYDWTQADGDFGYPLEVSSSLYRLSDVLRLVSGLSFKDPNTLESQMAIRAPRFSQGQPSMLCSDNSVAFSAPINRVQDVYENRVGANPALSTGSLADTFDRGLRIDVAALDGFVPSACHQEVEFSFEPRPARQTVK